uniref:POU domain protein n=1 Tax=Anser cygnoides TaxID=8845 RepID=A0A8B9DPU6_ANSCY
VRLLFAIAEQYIRRSGREPAGPRRSPGSRGHRLPEQEPPPPPAAPQPLQAGRHVPHHEHHPLDVDADPRDLEAFAERFKQRRIKLGVTQADVGSALANLKIPGVGSLSQSTICRFESLTLSHNNMIALKPILQAWLEEAEKSHREKLAKPELFSGAEKKRKRTSIAAPEKRSLEAYFALQPRPSSEKIAAIAEKLDLKKNVVRVWFCNQRQKQKRMKKKKKDFNVLLARRVCCFFLPPPPHPLPFSHRN